MRPDEADKLAAEAARLFQAGRREQSAAACRRVLAVNPNHATALNVLGLIRHVSRQFEEAGELFRAAIAADARRPEFFNNLGETLRASGNHEQAADAYRSAIAVRPDYAPAHNGLGEALRALGRLDDALAAARRAIELKPDYFKAYNNIGVTLNAMDRSDEAIGFLRRAIELKPDYAIALSNLGRLLEERGSDESVELLSRAVAANPNEPGPYSPLASALQRRGKTDAAIAAFEKALALNPADDATKISFAEVLMACGRADEALRLHPAGADVVSRNLLRVASATLLPPIYESHEDLARWRQRVEESIATLTGEGVTADLERHTVSPMFYLAFHGQNDREIQRAAAALCRAPTPPALSPRARADGRIHVGFISSNLGEHTIGLLNRGTIDRLSRDRFVVSVFSLGGGRPGPTEDFIRARADHFVRLPANVISARRALLEASLDVAFYTDVGMDRATYTLAFTRVAPVQAVTWGHPDTCGIPALDYFISSKNLDTEDAQAHYNERLVRLENLAVCYQRPPAPQNPSRAQFGLPEEANLYGVPQSLFKLHPDFDAVLAGILTRDARARIILLEPTFANWRQVLLGRLGRVTDVSRVIFLPRQSRDSFLALNAVCDVLLDPLHFGGGNTSYEAFAVGTPVVTLPSPFLRGRITLAQYTMMNLFDCVARDVGHYVDLAVRLGSDRAARGEVSGKIIAASPVLFDNEAGVRELEEFFVRATAQARAGEKGQGLPHG